MPCECGPLGRAIASALLARCFQEAKIPRSRRAGWPVVSGDDAVVWVPGVSRADSLIPEPGVEALRVDITDR